METALDYPYSRRLVDLTKTGAYNVNLGYISCVTGLGHCTASISESNLGANSYDRRLMKDRDILVTGNKWTLAANIALDDYIAFIQGMRVILVQIQKNVERYQSPNKKTLDIHWNEVSRLRDITNELEVDLESVSKLLSEEVPLKSFKQNPTRQRRGLINLFGYGLKYLFGTADAKDVK
jgi:hypothetical protein